MSDFADTSSLQSSIATAAGVSPSAVAIVVEAAGVRSSEDENLTLLLRAALALLLLFLPFVAILVLTYHCPLQPSTDEVNTIRPNIDLQISNQPRTT